MQSEKPTESNLEMLQINDLKSNCEELEKKMHTDAEKIIKNFYQSIQMANKPDDSSKIKYMNEFLIDLSKYIETNSAINVLKENINILEELHNEKKNDDVPKNDNQSMDIVPEENTNIKGDNNYKNCK